MANSYYKCSKRQQGKRVYRIDLTVRRCKTVVIVVSDSEKAFYTAFGRMLSEIRRKKRISQEMLADELGLSRTSITNIEKGRQPIQLYSLYLIARLLGADVKEFLPSAAVFERPERAKGLNVSRSEWLKAMDVMISHLGDDDAARRRTNNKTPQRE